MADMLGELRWSDSLGRPCIAALTLDGKWIIPDSISDVDKTRIMKYSADLLQHLNTYFSPALNLDISTSPGDHEAGIGELLDAAKFFGGTVTWLKDIGL